MTPPRLASVWSWLKRNPVFVITVAVPTVLAILYYGLIASDVYISESRFVVRSPQRPVSSGIFGEILQGTGITRSQDDTYSVRDFILSRLTAEPHLTLERLRAELAERGVTISHGALWNFVHRQGLSFKKKRSANRARSAGCRPPPEALEEVPNPD